MSGSMTMSVWPTVHQAEPDWLYLTGCFTTTVQTRCFMVVFLNTVQIGVVIHRRIHISGQTVYGPHFPYTSHFMAPVTGHISKPTLLRAMISSIALARMSRRSTALAGRSRRSVKWRSRLSPDRRTKWRSRCSPCWRQPPPPAEVGSSLRPRFLLFGCPCAPW